LNAFHGMKRVGDVLDGLHLSIDNVPVGPAKRNESVNIHVGGKYIWSQMSCQYLQEQEQKQHTQCIAHEWCRRTAQL
jgi:hypothetical protein